MNELLEILLTNPNGAKLMISEYVEQYKPLVYAISSELAKIYKDFAENEEYFKIVATHKMNQYKAYCEAGFDKEQAMQLLINDIQSIQKSLSNIKTSTK